MPQSPSRVATINLGMQTVTMAVFERADSGITLKAYERADLVPDPAADASRLGQLKVVLGEMRSKLDWKGGACACAIPSQGVFTRFVQIPKVEPDKVDQVLFFEAQQNVPYPIEDVAWAQQLLSPRTEDKLDALIVATKIESLEAAVEALAAAKLVPNFIETSPTALYNAFRFNYPDVPGCSLLIDIGARATNLLFIEGSDVFIRTVPVGGSSITAALQKRFEDRAFNQLEDFKRAEGLIPPPGNYDGAKSEEIAEMGKIARTVMTRIHNEITRSITFYRTSQKGAAPMRVLLAGGGASMPYTLEFFNEKLSLPIEFFNSLRRVGVSPTVESVSVSRSAHLLGECVGLALRELAGPCPLQISLRAPALHKSTVARQRRPFLVAAAIALVCTILLAALHFQSAGTSLARTNAEIQERMQPLQSMADEIAALAGERKRLLEDGASLAAAPFMRVAWSEIINELNLRQPPRNVWITRLSPSPAVPGFGEKIAANRTEASGQEGAPEISGISIEGLYLDSSEGPAAVDRFVDALAESPMFGITPENKNSVVLVRSAQSGDQWAYAYKLLVPLKRPLPL